MSVSFSHLSLPSAESSVASSISLFTGQVQPARSFQLSRGSRLVLMNTQLPAFLHRSSLLKCMIAELVASEVESEETGMVTMEFRLPRGN
ncbi:hypothetical protein V6N13_088044 [Hibiscus sabdariffa]|uniref:Uncharacterized protein n=1 Tax=Hibiscus sabdariffa TaxID=183260 RepID=A0ABR2FYH4_9ROSI